MKHFLYQIKHIYKKIFCYPRESITISDSIDYDIYWEDKRGKNIGGLSAWQKDRADFILKILSGERGAPVTIADVGCGDGSILSYLKNNAKDVVITKCTGYDSSEFALECAKNLGIETNHLDISQRESYKQISSADYFLLLETLEHIPDSEALLFSILSKSKRGVFFSFPNTGYMTHRLRFLFGRFPLQWRIYPNEHVRFWTFSDLKWWLKALNINTYKIHSYKGLPILNKLTPGLFAAAFIVYVPKSENHFMKIEAEA